MAITHKFIDELEEIELNQIFCNQPIEKNSKILVIGTFNPSKDSCRKTNNALWFYGRNNFWRCFPRALGDDSLHIDDNDEQLPLPQTWKDYCLKNKIVIIDMIKEIKTDEILQSFKDRELESNIAEDLSNVSIFNIEEAFKGVKFEKVIYSLKFSDNYIKRLKKIKERINEHLLNNNCIQNFDQIKYCKSPSRNYHNLQESWTNAIN